MQTTYGNQERKVDHLYRISLKGLIVNTHGDVLVVKESGRNYWDLPGGGMNHGEDIKTALARELNEEVGYSGSFTYRIIDLDEPEKFVTRDVWQIRMIVKITPDSWAFTEGVDCDEVAFMSAEQFKDSEFKEERLVYRYANLER